MESLEEAMATVRRDKPRRLYRTMRDLAALHPAAHDNRRRLIHVAARALVLLEMDDSALREALQDAPPAKPRK